MSPKTPKKKKNEFAVQILQCLDAVLFPCHAQCRYRNRNIEISSRKVAMSAKLRNFDIKRIPVLLYGLEVLQLNKSQISSIDFVINRFFMEMFNTNKTSATA